VSREFLRKSSELAAEGKPFVVATVVRVEGSSSARPGSKAIIDNQGKLVMGWVGGGCAEGAVRREALECIARQRPRLITLDMTDEVLGVGMPCGGIMDVYIDPVLPKPELLIVGHGRIAETLAALARLMNFSVTVDDPSADWKSFPDVDRLLTGDLDLSEAHIDTRTFVVIATQHKGDHIWLQKAIEAEAAYIALISSRHRASIVLDYVVANGVAPEKLNRVWAPAGLDLGAATPEEIALSIVSQMVALRRGGSGEPIKFKRAAADPADSYDQDHPKIVTECDVPGAVPR
jgi:xanthine dehydrogenase accessory factor